MQSQFGALVLQTISVLFGGWFRSYFWAGFGALRAVWGRLSDLVWWRSAGFGASCLGAGFGVLGLSSTWPGFVTFSNYFWVGFGDRFWG